MVAAPSRRYLYFWTQLVAVPQHVLFGTFHSEHPSVSSFWSGVTSVYLTLTSGALSVPNHLGSCLISHLLVLISLEVTYLGI